MYFVHSYVSVPRDRRLVAAESTHGIPFVSAIASGSLIAVQFHPERSGPAGMTLLENFLHFARLSKSPNVALPQRRETQSDHVAEADHSLS